MFKSRSSDLHWSVRNVPQDRVKGERHDISSVPS